MPSLPNAIPEKVSVKVKPLYEITSVQRQVIVSRCKWETAAPSGETGTVYIQHPYVL